MKETNVVRTIMLALGRFPSLKLFRNNVGTGWVGKVKTVKGGIFISDPRRLDAGLIEGSSDLIGWTIKTVTPDMVGKPVAIFTALEVKSILRGRASPNQIVFLDQVRQAGGICGVINNADDAKKLLNL